MTRSPFHSPPSQPILGVIADSGQLTRLAVSSGADFLLVLSAGIYRTQGVIALASFLPFHNSNDAAENLLLRHVLPAAAQIPAIVGLMPGDPTRDLDDRLADLQKHDVFGITNYPAVSIADGNLRAIYEEEGCTLDTELAMLQQAKRRGLAAVGFVNADPRQACRFAEIDIDALILTSGLTHVLDDIHERRDKVQLAIRQLNEALEAVRKVRPHLPCLAFGGPITMPEDLEQVYRQSSFDGFVGGSVFGRLPIESSVGPTVRRFKSVPIHRGEPTQTGLGSMLGGSTVMRRLFRLIERASGCDFNVCIEGESGVGKELVAMQIHRLSSRSPGPLVTLNCGAIPDTLLEAELFGWERGAFTGADRRRLGKFELADKGTLFLDEVGDLSPHGQVALLRAIQQREITRIGGNISIPVDHRIIAATNRPLAKLVEQSKFRADLYYRLNQITLTVPPLRDRLDDLRLLVAPILTALRVQLNRGSLDLASEFYDKLQQHSWPGNIRELQHVLYQSAIVEEGPLLKGSEFLPSRTRTDVSLTEQIDKEVESSRWQRVRQALRDADGNKSKAAAILGVTRKTLYAWLREMSL